MLIGTFNENYIFSSFWVSELSRLPLAAALAVAEEPTRIYNPLYVYGGTPEDRSHLLQAIGHRIDQRWGNARILYISSDRFVADVAEALAARELIRLHEKFSAVDVLLVDNVHLLLDSPAAQNELLHIIDSLCRAQRQVVVTSDHTPGELPLLNESLISQFQEGLIADFLPQTVDYLISLVKDVAYGEVAITDGAARAVATRLDPTTMSYGQTVPMIRQMLHELASSAYFRGNRIDLHLVDEVLPHLPSTIGANRRIELVDASEQMHTLLRKDISHIYQLTPDEFELVTCNLLTKHGFDVERSGSIYSPDGGVDIVAWPSKPTIPLLIAVQVKHHRTPLRKTGPSAVKDLQAVVGGGFPFHTGLLVTNTAFTPSAHWFANNRPHLVRLRDLTDLKRWVGNNFRNVLEWREITARIELGGTFITIPKGQKKRRKTPRGDHRVIKAKEH